MTMIDRDVSPEREEVTYQTVDETAGMACIEVRRGDEAHRYWVRKGPSRLGEAIERLEAREPKHRADVEPAVVQCCGEVIACPTCGEPVT